MVELFVGLAGVILGVVGLGAAAYTQYQVRRRRKAIQVSGLCGEPTILNLTAHPILHSEEDWAKGYTEVHVPTELDLASPDELESSLVEVIKGFPREIRQRIQAADPALVVAFPAPRGSASLLDPILHGICGEFVRTTWSVRTGNGFVWTKPVDRQMVRLRSRAKLRGVEA